MNKSLAILLIFLCFSLEAQKTISGTFSPSEQYTWIIAYRLKPGTQVYVTDTAIKDGAFSMKMPENAEPGTYRLVYAVPQEEYNFDIIYSGKEDIVLSFDQETGVSITNSEENKLLTDYFNQSKNIQENIISFYTQGNSDAKKFNTLIDEQKAIQKSFSEKSKDLVAHNFIVANKPYIPSNFESIQDYVANTKANYFNHIDFTNPALQASGFFTDKITNFVFTALPLNEMTKLETEIAMQGNVKVIDDKLTSVSETYKFHIYYTLWTQAAASSFNELSDFIYSEYLVSLANITNNQTIIEEIETHNRLRIGAKAPNIIWKKDNKAMTLYDLDKASHYILVFWSSTCGHCLKELPVLHKSLENNTNVKVIAVGLEDDNLSWKTESDKLNNFEHVISLGKWQSDYAQLYAITQTPSYFILDKEKKIIKKPEDQISVLEYLNSKDK